MKPLPIVALLAGSSLLFYLAPLPDYGWGVARVVLFYSFAMSAGLVAIAEPERRTSLVAAISLALPLNLIYLWTSNLNIWVAGKDPPWATRFLFYYFARFAVATSPTGWTTPAPTGQDYVGVALLVELALVVIAYYWKRSRGHALIQGWRAFWFGLLLLPVYIWVLDPNEFWIHATAVPWLRGVTNADLLVISAAALAATAIEILNPQILQVRKKDTGSRRPTSDVEGFSVETFRIQITESMLQI